MKHIKGFDTLRAFSIILVLLTHLGMYSWLPESTFIKGKVWFLISGTTGVQIFFTLSGFLITRILLLEKEEFGGINFVHFYARRFLRLLPPLLVFFMAIAILMKLDLIPSTQTGFLFAFFYIYNFVPNQYYTVELGHTWSLALEEQYYLIWPFVVHFFKKYFVYAIITTLLVACIWAVYALPGMDLTKGFKYSRWFIPAVAPIITGSLFALLIQQFDVFFKSYFSQNYFVLLAGIIVFLYPLYASNLRITYLFLAIGVSMVLVWIFYNQESAITRVLSFKPLAFIGKISYGIYVYQGLFLRTGPAGAKLWIQQFPQNLILTFTAAVISFYLLEKPILRLKSHFRR